MAKIILLLLFLLSLFEVQSQKTSKSEMSLYTTIYQIAIDSFVEKKPSHFFIVDSTDNKGIQEANFSAYVNDIRFMKKSTLDSSWYFFLKKADELKKKLLKVKVGGIRSSHAIELINKDSLTKYNAEKYLVGNIWEKRYGWIDGWMTISTPILSQKKDKAIVEISYVMDALAGHGGILLLKKKKDKWTIVEYFQTWKA